MWTLLNADKFEMQTRSSAGAYVANNYQITNTATGASRHTWWIGGSEALRIDSDGDVGIGGTATPSEKLHINGTGETALVTNVSYTGNQNAPYLIAGSTNYTGATTNWGTYGIQHRFKSTSGGISRVTVDARTGEAFAVWDQSTPFAHAPNGIGLGVAAGSIPSSANILDDYEEGTWTPTLTGITIGDGTVSGQYTKIGRIVHCKLLVTLGSTSSVTGSISFPLPTVANAAVGHTVGSGYFVDVGTGYFPALVRVPSTTTVNVDAIDTSGADAKGRGASATIPFTWTTGDQVAISLTYTAA